MKQIELTKGQIAIVDDEDFEMLSQWKWYACKHPRGKTYYARRSKDDVAMHRLLLGLTDPNIFADHEDCNGLNNQKYNLRIATYSQNNANINSHSDSNSKYLGVHLSIRKYKDKQYRFWYAQIRKNKKSIWIGSFKTEEEAALAYNEKAIQVHGEFAKLNKVA